MYFRLSFLGLRPAELNIPKFNAPSREYFTRVENLPRCNEQVLMTAVPPTISPCTMAGSTTTVDSSVCCTAPPFLGYQMSPSLSPNAQLNKIPSRYQQASTIPSTSMPFLHARPSSKVQVWRPW